jgi:hypothetical protein
LLCLPRAPKKKPRSPGGTRGVSECSRPQRYPVVGFIPRFPQYIYVQHGFCWASLVPQLDQVITLWKQNHEAEKTSSHRVHNDYRAYLDHFPPFILNLRATTTIQSLPQQNHRILHKKYLLQNSMQIDTSEIFRSLIPILPILHSRARNPTPHCRLSRRQVHRGNQSDLIPLSAFLQQRQAEFLCSQS